MRFKVSRTYSEWTPESSVDGEFSDTGFVFEDQVYSLRELIYMIKSEGLKRQGDTMWYETGTWTEDYSTGTERQENVHIELVKRGGK